MSAFAHHNRTAVESSSTAASGASARVYLLRRRAQMTVASASSQHDLSAMRIDAFNNSGAVPLAVVTAAPSSHTTFEALYAKGLVGMGGTSNVVGDAPPPPLMSNGQPKPASSTPASALPLFLSSTPRPAALLADDAYHRDMSAAAAREAADRRQRAEALVRTPAMAQREAFIAVCAREDGGEGKGGADNSRGYRHHHQQLLYPPSVVDVDEESQREALKNSVVAAVLQSSFTTAAATSSAKTANAHNANNQHASSMMMMMPRLHNATVMTIETGDEAQEYDVSGGRRGYPMMSMTNGGRVADSLDLDAAAGHHPYLSHYTTTTTTSRRYVDLDESISNTTRTTHGGAAQKAKAGAFVAMEHKAKAAALSPSPDRFEVDEAEAAKDATLLKYSTLQTAPPPSASSSILAPSHATSSMLSPEARRAANTIAVRHQPPPVVYSGFDEEARQNFSFEGSKKVVQSYPLLNTTVASIATSRTNFYNSHNTMQDEAVPPRRSPPRLAGAAVVPTATPSDASLNANIDNITDHPPQPAAALSASGVGASRETSSRRGVPLAEAKRVALTEEEEIIVPVPNTPASTAPPFNTALPLPPPSQPPNGASSASAQNAPTIPLSSDHPPNGNLPLNAHTHPPYTSSSTALGGAGTVSDALNGSQAGGHSAVGETAVTQTNALPSSTATPQQGGGSSSAAAVTRSLQPPPPPRVPTTRATGTPRSASANNSVTNRGANGGVVVVPPSTRPATHNNNVSTSSIPKAVGSGRHPEGASAFVRSHEDHFGAGGAITSPPPDHRRLSGAGGEHSSVLGGTSTGNGAKPIANESSVVSASPSLPFAATSSLRFDSTQFYTPTISADITANRAKEIMAAMRFNAKLIAYGGGGKH